MEMLPSQFALLAQQANESETQVLRQEYDLSESQLTEKMADCRGGCLVTKSRLTLVIS